MLRPKYLQCFKTVVEHFKACRTLCTQPRTDKQNFILRHPEDLIIPDATLQDIVWRNIDKWADKTATICSETGRSYTYGDLRKKIINFSKALRGRLGLKRKDTVAILLPNVPEYPIVLFGIIEANLIATTINPIYTAEEIAKQLINSNTKVIVTLGNCFKTTIDAINLAKQTIPVITVKTKQGESTPSGAIDFQELCDSRTNFTLEEGNPDDVIIMPYSSGTTGLPKGVELTHKNIVANLHQILILEQMFKPTTAESQESAPAVLPSFHIYGMVINTFVLLYRGLKVITVPKFSPETFIETLKEHKPEHLFIVPPIVIFLAGHPSVKKEHLDSVRMLMSGAAPLGNTDIERFSNKVKKDVMTLQGYGMTETSPVITTTLVESWKESIGSAGQVVQNTDLKIVAVDDPTETPLGPHQQGELVVKGPQVMLRYHNNPTATNEVLKDGWLKTGDIGYYDDQKNVWITDRLKELIKVKGFQVAPAELEAIIRNHPEVSDAAVTGISHPLSGEVPRAFVVTKSGAKVTAEDIKNYVAQHVASYKKLEGGVVFLDAIPKNASGKIMRRYLKSM